MTGHQLTRTDRDGTRWSRSRPHTSLPPHWSAPAIPATPLVGRSRDDRAVPAGMMLSWLRPWLAHPPLQPPLILSQHKAVAGHHGASNETVGPVIHRQLPTGIST